ncbi:MAG: hypothetical protein KFW07_04105 [Mycoplasmataceae bacterium]|nr:hypothetical protein [Mycoplasmataceae bacterium]
MFETFSGIGAQHKVLQFLKDNYSYKYCNWSKFQEVDWFSYHPIKQDDGII